jgi:hypothetical protein
LSCPIILAPNCAHVYLCFPFGFLALYVRQALIGGFSSFCLHLSACSSFCLHLSACTTSSCRKRQKNRQKRTSAGKDLSRKEWEGGFDLFDVDGDGIITRAEFTGGGGSLAIFDVLDADGDGHITRKEYNAGFDMDLESDVNDKSDLEGHKKYCSAYAEHVVGAISD